MATIRLRIGTKRPGQCASVRCRAALDWYRTVAGAAMPMNRGAIAIALETDATTHEPIGLFNASESHWATCPARELYTHGKLRR